MDEDAREVYRKIQEWTNEVLIQMRPGKPTPIYYDQHVCLTLQVLATRMAEIERRLAELAPDSRSDRPPLL